MQPGLSALTAEYDNMLACVRCGLCLTSCPTYVLTLHEAESPRGRIAMLRALVEGQLDATPNLLAHQASCLVCDACSAVCPAGVRMDPIQVAFRAAVAAPAGGRLRRWVQRVTYRQVFGRMGVLRALVRLLWLAQRTGAHATARRLGLLRLLRLGEAGALLPPLPARLLVPRGEVYEPLSRSPHLVGKVAGADPAAATVSGTCSEVVGGRVAFFAGCVMSTALAEIDRATIRVLQRAGHTVLNPAGQGCCGALQAHGGDLDMAKTLARRTITAFERAPDTPVIVNSAGCGAMLKDYAHLLRDDPAWADRARAFAARVRDLSEFLAAHPPTLGPLALTATYQDPCHLAHAQRITRQPRALLGAIPGLMLREMGESGLCCGSAGVYNLTHPRESRALRARKLDHALATGAEVIVTANPGCLLQLRAGLAERGSTVQVKHIAELLDAAGAGDGGAGIGVGMTVAPPDHA